MRRSLETAANLFPLWVLAACGAAMIHPPWFTWFKGEAIVIGLAVIMLGMGITLSLDDFARVATRPVTVAIGFAAQFLIMPLAGWTRHWPSDSFSLPAVRGAPHRMSSRTLPARMLHSRC